MRKKALFQAQPLLKSYRRRDNRAFQTWQKGLWPVFFSLGLFWSGAPSFALSAFSAQEFIDLQSLDASDPAISLVKAAWPKKVLLKSVDATFHASDSFQSLTPQEKARLHSHIVTIIEQDWPQIEGALIGQLKRTYSTHELQKLLEFENLRRQLARTKLSKTDEEIKKAQNLKAVYQKALENPLIADYSAYGLDYYSVQTTIEAIFHKAYGSMKAEPNSH
jgi:hypothetical protein